MTIVSIRQKVFWSLISMLLSTTFVALLIVNYSGNLAVGHASAVK